MHVRSYHRRGEVSPVVHELVSRAMPGRSRRHTGPGLPAPPRKRQPWEPKPATRPGTKPPEPEIPGGPRPEPPKRKPKTKGKGKTPITFDPPERPATDAPSEQERRNARNRARREKRARDKLARNAKAYRDEAERDRRAARREAAKRPDLPPLSELRAWRKATPKSKLEPGDEVRVGDRTATVVARVGGKRTPRVHIFVPATGEHRNVRPASIDEHRPSLPSIRIASSLPDAAREHRRTQRAGLLDQARRERAGRLSHAEQRAVADGDHTSARRARAALEQVGAAPAPRPKTTGPPVPLPEGKPPPLTRDPTPHPSGLMHDGQELYITRPAQAAHPRYLFAGDEVMFRGEGEGASAGRRGIVLNVNAEAGVLNVWQPGTREQHTVPFSRIHHVRQLETHAREAGLRKERLPKSAQAKVGTVPIRRRELLADEAGEPAWLRSPSWVEREGRAWPSAPGDKFKHPSEGEVVSADDYDLKNHHRGGEPVFGFQTDKEGNLPPRASKAQLNRWLDLLYAKKVPVDGHGNVVLVSKGAVAARVARRAPHQHQILEEFEGLSDRELRQLANEDLVDLANIADERKWLVLAGRIDALLPKRLRAPTETALDEALVIVGLVEDAAFEQVHPRAGAGSPTGGQFVKGDDGGEKAQAASADDKPPPKKKPHVSKARAEALARAFARARVADKGVDEAYARIRREVLGRKKSTDREREDLAVERWVGQQALVHAKAIFGNRLHLDRRQDAGDFVGEELRGLLLFPDGILRDLVARGAVSGVWVSSAPVNKQDDMAHQLGPDAGNGLAGWNEAAGVYTHETHQVVVTAGAGDDTLLHELGHAVGDLYGADNAPELIAAHQRLFPRLNPYLRQDGPDSFAGRQELFAEGVREVLSDPKAAAKDFDAPFVAWIRKVLHV